MIVMETSLSRFWNSSPVIRAIPKTNVIRVSGFAAITPLRVAFSSSVVASHFTEIILKNPPDHCFVQMFESKLCLKRRYYIKSNFISIIASMRAAEIPGPPFKAASLERQKSLCLYALKLPSADTAVVRRTLASLTQNPQGLEGADEAKEHREKRREFWAGVKPAHFSVKFGSESLWQIVQLMTIGLLIGLLGAFAFGRRLLLKFPGLLSLGWFRKTGPTEEEVNSATFKMWFVGRGYSDADSSPAAAKPDTEIITRVSGPEIGYVATPIILIQCALILLSERRNLPNGVYPPGIVFGHTNLQEGLQANGICFDFISKRSLQPR